MEPRPCWYQIATHAKWRGGKLHGWGTDCEGVEDGYAPFPAGIIEDDKTGCVHSIYVTRICFASVPPGKIDRC